MLPPGCARRRRQTLPDWRDVVTGDANDATRLRLRLIAADYSVPAGLGRAGTNALSRRWAMSSAMTLIRTYVGVLHESMLLPGETFSERLWM